MSVSGRRWVRLGAKALHDVASIGFGGGLTWEFHPSWTLNPEVLYIRDQSNILAANYSSTEIWITLRKDF